MAGKCLSMKALTYTDSSIDIVCSNPLKTLSLKSVNNLSKITDVGLPMISSGIVQSLSPCTCKQGTSPFGEELQLLGIKDEAGGGNETGGRGGKEQNSERRGIKVDNAINPPNLCGLVNVVYIA